MNYLEKYEYWCTSTIFDQKTRNELIKIKENDKEIKDRFYKDLEFGTAGMRGIMGVGSNYMNKYTVQKATQGLANYIIKENSQEKGVAIAYDSRNMSKEFSDITALCLNANGIKTYVFKELKPVPELSYAVITLKCIAGVMITASHNPAKYNGYKVYSKDGAQITSPIDKMIIDEVNATNYEDIKTIDKEEAIQKGLYNVIDDTMENNYIAAIKKSIMNPDIIKEIGKELKIAYTPFHGAGAIPVKRVLAELGFENVYTVPEQEKPDGNFPTVSYPNPEEKEAFELVLKLAKEKDVDIVLATDPDADRLGIYAKDTKTGEYIAFTGNMSALLIAEYLLSEKKKRNIIPKNGAILTTIVSSNLTDKIAAQYDVTVMKVLTGFKFIGQKMKQFEENKDYQYLFGFEESYGCLTGTHARDKDAVEAVMLLCEAAAYYKKQGLTLWDQMINIYEKYGYFKESIFSIVLEGADGSQKMKKIMENLRENPLNKIGENKVTVYSDYQTGKIKNLVTGEESKSELPISNVLYYDLSDNNWCCIRPSGTEPKIKCYIGVKGNNMQDAEEKLYKLEKGLRAVIQE